MYGQPIYGEVLYGTIYGTIFFPNNAVIKIDLNLHINVIIPIFTSFMKLLLDFTRILQKKYLEHYLWTLFHTDPPFHRPTMLSVA